MTKKVDRPKPALMTLVFDPAQALKRWPKKKDLRAWVSRLFEDALVDPDLNDEVAAAIEKVRIRSVDAD